MIEFALRRRLKPVINRRRRLHLTIRLSIYWLIAGLVGAFLITADWLWGWSSSLANWALFIATVLATVWALYKYRRMQPDYRAVARNIEQKHPEAKALLLAAIEQESDEGRYGYLQERVIGEALRHAIDNNWLQSIPTKKIVLANVGRAAALLFLILVMAQVFPFQPLLFKTNKGILTNRGYQITITPEDTSVELGAAVVILARFNGKVPTEVSLLYGPKGREPQRMELTKNLDDPVFGGLIPSVDNDLIYYIEYANERTRDYKISAFRHPALESADAKIIYPSYTKLPEKIIKNTRQISVVEGSQVEFTFTLNKPVTTAKLTPRDGFSVDLTVDNQYPNVYTTSIEAVENQRYELKLADAQGLTNKMPPRFVIDVHKNLPPEIIPQFPSRDVQVSAIEELTLEADVSDDYGLTGYGFSYNLVGKESKDITLGPPVETEGKQQLQYLLAFEDLKAQPDQLLTYYFWADDMGPDGNIRRTASDIYFAEVRPFEEIFRESQSSQNEQNQQRENQSGQQGQQQEELIELQKQIISATWNIKQRAELSGGIEEQKENLDVVRQSQADALQQAQSALTGAEEPGEINTLQQAANHMTTSLEHLTDASESDKTSELTPALGAEQLAYQELLKLRERESQVALSRNPSNQGRSGSARSNQQLEQLELSQRENRYETQRLAQSQQQTAQREDLQVLNRLRDLARRQNEMSDRLRDAQAELQQARTDEEREEIERELKRLRQQQLEALDDVDELQQRMDRPENRQRMANAREQLEQSRSRINQSAEQLEEGMVSDAATSATRAQRQLEQMRDEIQRRTSGEFSEQMRNILDETRQLDRQQKEIAEEIEQQIESQQKTLTGSMVNRELSDEIEQQRSSANQLLEEMKEVSEQSENSEPLLSRKLYDTIRQANNDNVDRALETTGQLLRRNFLPQARDVETQAREGIENMREGVEDAARNVLSDPADSLRLAREQLDELIRQVDQETERANNINNGRISDSNEPMEGSTENQPRQAQDQTGQQNQNGQPQEQSQQGRASANASENENTPQDSERTGGRRSGSQRDGSDRQQGANTETARDNEGGQIDTVGWGGFEAGQWDRNDPNGPFTGQDFTQWSDRLRDVEEILTERQLREEAARVRDRATAIRAEFKRHGKEPQWDLVQQQILNPLTELRQRVSEKLAQLQSDEALVPIDRDPVPDRYVELVRRYYENLGEDD